MKLEIYSLYIDDGFKHISVHTDDLDSLSLFFGLKLVIFKDIPFLKNDITN